jgi:hypothetical protein
VEAIRVDCASLPEFIRRSGTGVRLRKGKH